MGRILFVLLLAFLIFVGVGFYMEWFTLTLSGNDAGFKINFLVDKKKIDKDKDKAEKGLKKLEEKATGE